MLKIKLYTTQFCGFCHAAIHLLDSLNLKYEQIDVTTNRELRDQISKENNGYATVPMIFINDRFIGGYTELRELAKNGSLK